jgi:[ribosomal protein S5]-alanine N-acetyltransferase
MRTLRTGAFVLEPQTAAHAPEMFAVLSDPAIYEFENAPPESEAYLLERFTKLESRQSRDGSEQWLNWVIRLPSGELAGYVQATVTQTGLAYVAYELASRFWRQGIGSASVQAMLDELSTHYRVTQFYAVLKARNFRSEAMLKALGFALHHDPEAAGIECEPDEIVMHRPALVAS